MVQQAYNINEEVSKGRSACVWCQLQAFEANTTALNIEYRQIYDLTAYLLTRYRDTGKAFYLGNWEADW